MTPEEIQALIDANKAELTVLESDLKEAVTKVWVDTLIVKLIQIKDDYEAETITAQAAEYEFKIAVS